VVASARTAHTARAKVSGVHLDGSGKERLREAGSEAGGAERRSAGADGSVRLRDKDDAGDAEGDNGGDGGGRCLAQQPRAGVDEGAPQEEEPLADDERAATCNQTLLYSCKLRQSLKLAGTAHGQVCM